ncbi:serine/threonine-protein phosphatase 7 long form homolog [Dioscorea cayenensis subsp. rotundata]|uniref:Serine/threonine-protein phosphatase 7 long form homolog n=1 Tax=Dioscorea cayennensis subsp. rotundata TaxID=55577 RepID=A0AB40B9N1_DIOCR|nr:serine/threonine-protein phosphatase 7 long form homolog [Dioscorea cayenensis subsp. rotundata]
MAFLRLQSDHISSILSEKPDRVLRCRHVSIAEPPPQIIGLLREAGFYHAAQILSFRIDAALVSALVERWRTETHTFHLTCGETTITLKDVALLLGLPINGHEVIGQTSDLRSALCAELLGVVPPAEQRKGQSITLTWLEETFGMMSYDAGQRQIECYARAYILRLIGCVLMPDMSQNRVHLKWLPLLRDFTDAGKYSWGSACLATLYRSLCRASNKDMKNISGSIILLQSWAWWAHIEVDDDSRSNKHNVKIYRQLLDRLEMQQFIWRPYDSNEIIAQVPHDIFADRTLWTAFTSLICFEVVEWHQTDRVTRQFGFTQGVPLDPVCIGLTHDHDLRGRINTDWALITEDGLDSREIERHVASASMFLPGITQCRWNIMPSDLKADLIDSWRSDIKHIPCCGVTLECKLRKKKVNAPNVSHSTMAKPIGRIFLLPSCAIANNKVPLYLP